MVLANMGGSAATMFATLLFAALAGGVFFGLFRLARRWEDEVP
jgi:hypothetical protein